jgi:hypothetical protein
VGVGRLWRRIEGWGGVGREGEKNVQVNVLVKVDGREGFARTKFDFFPSFFGEKIAKFVIRA